jgi:hypothetical protein
MTTPRRTEISLADRAAIVALRSEGRGWVYISSKVKRVSPNGAQTLYNRTVRRAGSTELTHLLLHLESAPRPGRPKRSLEDSAEADLMVSLATSDEEHEELFHRALDISDALPRYRGSYASG